jgi:hypothetical protein
MFSARKPFTTGRSSWLAGWVARLASRVCVFSNRRPTEDDMKSVPKYVSGKRFLEMNGIEKLGFVTKLLIFFLTFGFVFPRILSYYGQAGLQVKS